MLQKNTLMCAYWSMCGKYGEYGTFVSPSADSRRAVVSYWRKYVHEVLVNRLGGVSLPRKNVVRLTDRLDMTLDVYRGRKTTMQQQQQYDIALTKHFFFNFADLNKLA